MNIEERLTRLERIFAGNIAEYERRKDAEARQALRAQEAGAPGPNYFKNRERLAQEAERAKSFPKRQS